MVKRRLLDADCSGDFARRSGGVSLVPEQIGRGIEQSFCNGPFTLGVHFGLRSLYDSISNDRPVERPLGGSRNMKRTYGFPGILAVVLLAPVAQFAKDVAPASLGGVTCQMPPTLHCPDANCPGSLVIEQGTAIEPKTGRKFFLDFPCDMKHGEKVTFILSLHGAGSYGNWQRHYFPIMDYAKKYRLVIATPNSPTRIWSSKDDEYLQNIVTLVYDQLGTK